MGMVFKWFLLILLIENVTVLREVTLSELVSWKRHFQPKCWSELRRIWDLLALSQESPCTQRHFLTPGKWLLTETRARIFCECPAVAVFRDRTSAFPKVTSSQRDARAPSDLCSDSHMIVTSSIPDTYFHAEGDLKLGTFLPPLISTGNLDL